MLRSTRRYGPRKRAGLIGSGKLKMSDMVKVALIIAAGLRWCGGWWCGGWPLSD